MSEKTGKKVKDLILVNTSANMGGSRWENAKAAALDAILVALTSGGEVDIEVHALDQNIQPIDRAPTPTAGRPTAKTADAILEKYQGQALNVIHVTDSGYCSPKAYEFYKHLQAAGNSVNIISVVESPEAYRQTLPDSLRDSDFASAGISLQRVPIEKKYVLQGILNILNGTVETPKPDTRPDAVRKAEQELTTALEVTQNRIKSLGRDKKDCDQRISLLKEKKQRLSTEFRNLSRERTQIEKALGGLRGKAAPKKAAPKKKP